MSKNNKSSRATSATSATIPQPSPQPSGTVSSEISDRPEHWDAAIRAHDLICEGVKILRAMPDVTLNLNGAGDVADYIEESLECDLSFEVAEILRRRRVSGATGGVVDAAEALAAAAGLTPAERKVWDAYRLIRRAVSLLKDSDAPFQSGDAASLGCDLDGCDQLQELDITIQKYVERAVETGVRS